MRKTVSLRCEKAFSIRARFRKRCEVLLLWDSKEKINQSISAYWRCIPDIPRVTIIIENTIQYSTIQEIQVSFITSALVVILWRPLPPGCVVDFDDYNHDNMRTKTVGLKTGLVKT